MRTEGFECGSRNAECGKKTKSEFGSQELEHSVKRTDVGGQRVLSAEVGMRNADWGTFSTSWNLVFVFWNFRLVRVR